APQIWARLSPICFFWGRGVKLNDRRKGGLQWRHSLRTKTMSYVIGIDGGTESLRADIFDLSGRCVASVKTPYETHFPSPGHAEQNPDEWWKALGQSVSSAVAKPGIAGGEIDAIGIDTTSCSVVALDDLNRPLRPAIIWMDVRAVREAEFILATGDPALVVNGGGSGPISAEWMLPKALWLKR